ncbi:MAG: YjbH domain-containing protein [Bacteroidaceae bacterium]|nr:YjbH domain-containing protein [Bacteroidaceae bacterium]
MRNFLYITVFIIFSVFPICNVSAQYYVGTTGLLHMPTADMQKDKTVMIGGSFLNKKVIPVHWTYDTFNYYFDITIFPWLEISYDLTLHKGLPNSYWPKRTWGKFVNQDRQFSARFRLWKEGWYYDWTPQVVFGTNDPGSHEDHGGGGIIIDDDNNTNHFTRFFLAATKHLIFDGIGEIGAHAVLIYSREDYNYFTRPAVGANFEIQLLETDKWQKWVNGLNLMGEFDGEGINLGASYKIWRDNINVIVELHECKYFSGGIFFKLHLK